MIEFPVFSSKDKDSWTLHFIGLAIIIVGLFILFPSINPGIFIIFILAYIFLHKRKKGPLKPIGKVYLNTHQIRTITELNEFHFDLANLAQVEIIYSGYKGKRMQSDLIGPFNTYSGNDNFIHIPNSGG